MGDTRIIVFTRPMDDPGAKSRLAAGIGAADTLRLHRALVRRAVRAACESGAGTVEMCVAVEAPAFTDMVTKMKEQFPPSVTYTIQQGADLGERMFNAAYRALDTHGSVVIMGTDCAVLEAHHIRDSVAVLSDDTPACFIPAEDGGYVLVALARCDRGLFRNITWGTTIVMDETRTAMRRLGWQWVELPTLWDIDTPGDYQRLERDGLLESLIVA